MVYLHTLTKCGHPAALHIDRPVLYHGMKGLDRFLTPWEMQKCGFDVLLKPFEGCDDALPGG